MSATIAQKAMSVAHGIAQPRARSAGPRADVSARYMSAGNTIPPTAAANSEGHAGATRARRPVVSPQRTSFAASAKKKPMPISFTDDGSEWATRS